MHFRRDEELRVYLALMAAGSALITIELLTRGHRQHATTRVRNGVFQTVSVMTGTGFASTDYAQWTALTFSVLLLLMFVGGMAGSPTGALKVARHLLIWKFVGREIRRALHPQAVMPLRVSRRPVDDQVLASAVAFTLLYVLVFVVAALLLLLDASQRGSFQAEVLDAFAASAATLGNVGPGLGLRRADGQLRAVLGRLEAAHVRADVDGPPRADPRDGAADAGLLALVGECFQRFRARDRRFGVARGCRPGLRS